MFFGLPADVAGARYLYELVEQAFATETELFKRSELYAGHRSGDRRSATQSFQTGLAHGIAAQARRAAPAAGGDHADRDRPRPRAGQGGGRRGGAGEARAAVPRPRRRPGPVRAAGGLRGRARGGRSVRVPAGDRRGTAGPRRVARRLPAEAVGDAPPAAGAAGAARSGTLPAAGRHRPALRHLPRHPLPRSCASKGAPAPLHRADRGRPRVLPPATLRALLRDHRRPEAADHERQGPAPLDPARHRPARGARGRDA